MKRVVLASILLAASLAAAQTLPAGTALRAHIQNTLTSFNSKSGDFFSARVSEAIAADGHLLIPAGATIQGRVTKVSDPRRIMGKATIGIRPESIVFPSGEALPISASLVDTSLRNGTDVDDEGRFKGPGHDRKDWFLLGGGTGGGLLIGGLSAGAAGTPVGAGIGAGAGIGTWLYRKHEAVLPKGTELTIELDRPLILNSISGQ